MNESKHILTSKSFITGLVGALSGIAMIACSQYGININIDQATQGGAVVVICGLFTALRAVTSKPVYIVKQKRRASDVAADVVEADRELDNER